VGQIPSKLELTLRLKRLSIRSESLPVKGLFMPENSALLEAVTHAGTSHE
jgi:hypothetical protein